MSGRESLYVVWGHVQVLLENYGWYAVGAAVAAAVAGPPLADALSTCVRRAHHALTYDAAAAAARAAEFAAARAARIEELQVRARLAQEEAAANAAKKRVDAANAKPREPGFGGGGGGGGGDYRPLAGGGGLGPRPRIVSTMRNPPRAAGG